MHKYEWKESQVAIGDNANVLNPDPGSEEGTKSHPRKSAVTLHNFSSQF